MHLRSYAWTMLQITHFCGVKFLAWKSGSVNFLTNIMSDDEYDEIVCLFKNKSRQLAIKKRQNRGWGVSEWTWPILCFCFFLKPPAKTFEFVQGIRFCPMHHRRSLHSGIGKNFCKSWQHTFGFWTTVSKWILTTLWVQGGKIFALAHFHKIIFCSILAWILFLPAIIYVDGKMHVKITITGLKGY